MIRKTCCHDGGYFRTFDPQLAKVVLATTATYTGFLSLALILQVSPKDLVT